MLQQPAVAMGQPPAGQRRAHPKTRPGRRPSAPCPAAWPARWARPGPAASSRAPAGAARRTPGAGRRARSRPPSRPAAPRPAAAAPPYGSGRRGGIVWGCVGSLPGQRSPMLTTHLSLSYCCTRVVSQRSAARVELKSAESVLSAAAAAAAPLPGPGPAAPTAPASARPGRCMLVGAGRGPLLLRGAPAVCPQVGAAGGQKSPRCKATGARDRIVRSWMQWVTQARHQNPAATAARAVLCSVPVLRLASPACHFPATAYSIRLLLAPLGCTPRHPHRSPLNGGLDGALLPPGV